MKINEKTLNYIKSITAQTISNAGSGHVGASLGMSSFMLALFKDHYNFDVSDTDFLNRDRLVLSAGHACPLYYTLLSLFGFDLTLDDLKKYRSYGSRTPGHPEYGVTDGVEASTGPLGQGVATAVGMALAQSILAERFNSVGFPIIDNYTYCVVSDGDLMEGISQEAFSMAGALGLKKLIFLYDSNDVTIDGSLSISNRENVAKKFKAMGFNVIKVKKGNDVNRCSRAIAFAKKSDKPVMIIFKTTIGIGTAKEGTSLIHSGALNEKELQVFNEKLGVFEKFYIPSDVRDYCMASTRRGKLNHEKWNQDLAVYSNSNPDLYKQFISYFDRKKVDLEKIAKNCYKLEGQSGIDFNSAVLKEISDKLLQVVGGSADLASATKAVIESAGRYQAENRRGRNINFGVREHAMAGICNGIALYEDFMPYCSTFLAFSDYMLPAIRMAALMKLNVLYIFTHDSIHVGKDGPTHQPIEQLGQLRLIPNLKVFRPCDANELVCAYKFAISGQGPCVIVLSKQEIPVVEGTSIKDASFGGYIVSKAAKAPKVVLYATGSEVALAQSIQKELDKKFSTSVVSLPCLEIFEEQALSYKNKVLQKEAALRVVIEASNDNVWHRYLREEDIFISANEFYSSGKGSEVYSKAGFNAKEIAKKIARRLEKK